MRKFKFQKSDYPITVGWFQAVDEFPNTFELHLADLVSDPVKSLETVNDIMINDQTIIKLMWYYLKDHIQSMDWVQFLKTVTNEEVQEFRDTFWECVLDFSGPLKANLLKQMRAEVTKELREVTLEELASRSSQEASTQTP